MSTPKEFFRYNTLEHFRFPKTFRLMSEYILIIEQLNKSSCNWRYRTASKCFYLVAIIELLVLLYKCVTDLDRLHAPFFLDNIQLGGQKKYFSCNFLIMALMCIYLYYKCYFDYPPSLLKQLKSIDDNETGVLFPFSFSYKGVNVIDYVKKRIEKMLRIYIIYNFTEGIFVLKLKKINDFTIFARSGTVYQFGNNCFPCCT